ncbi:hypothetical protein ACQUW5_13290 [Legionella sp. CNM-1927-20]|uniref:hypothetical protein n=1 Tax=Legionella sp. CNM-1927-20 TaxID=3422221 RepID=UPI00403ABBB0
MFLTDNPKKAVFLDKCIYWWQISKYTLGNNQIWFTRSITEIANELAISERTVGRYLKELVNNGLLEKTCKLSASNKKGSFKVTKRLYIRITDKLIHSLQSTDIKKIPISQKIETESKGCSFLYQNDRIEKDNLSTPIYKDQNYNYLINNIVSQKDKIENNMSKSEVQRNYPYFTVEKIIGERIDEQTKNYIKGMMSNLQKQHHIKFSSPEQIFAEIVFTVTNQAQLKNVETTRHKVQIIAKLLREKRWLTPKGFYNHTDYGYFFKKVPHTNLKYKKNNLLLSKKAQLEEINRLIACEQRHLKEILYKQDQKNSINDLLIQSIGKRCGQLKLEASLLKKEIEECKDAIQPLLEKETNQLHKRTYLNELLVRAEQLRLQVNKQFEKYCFTLENKQAEPHLHDEEYKKYEQLNQQLNFCEMEISDLEYNLYINEAA